MRQRRPGRLRAAWVLGVLAAVLVLPPLLLGGVQGRWCECEFRSALREAKEVEARRLEARRIGDAKHAALLELLAGRITLATAAERYRSLSAESPQFPMRAVRQTFPAKHEQESWCRCVLACAAMELMDHPRSEGDTLGRLREEFAQLAVAWSK